MTTPRGNERRNMFRGGEDRARILEVLAKRLCASAGSYPDVSLRKERESGVMGKRLSPGDVRAQMDAIYRDVPLDRIPWNIATPPAELVAFVDSAGITPCDVVDLGCGAGNYAIWFATRGFRATGIDLSSEAVAIAGRNAAERGVACRFVAGDVMEGVPGLDDSFDFAFDWEVFHHIFPDEREAYVRNVHRMLRTGATYLSVSFSEYDSAFGGEGRFRTTPLGTVLCFSSEAEMRGLLEPMFDLLDLRTVEVGGKTACHAVVWAHARKR